MKLVRKLTIVLMAGALFVLTGHALVRVRREISLFESDIRRDHHVLGRFLSAAVREAWRTEGREAALRLVTQANERESHLVIRWVPPGARAAGGEGPAVDLDPSALTREISLEAHLAGLGPHLVTYVPVAADGPSFGAIEIRESLGGRDAYIRQTIINILIATTALFALCALVAAGAGVWIVGRPMRALAARARRIGEGDLSGRLVLPQMDEIGELARELNAMCDRLEAAREELARQTAARIAALEQLRHTDRLATVGKLASGIAHELGTPLNVVAGRAKMIATGEAAGEEALECARIVVAQADRIAGIIRQLLDFSRRRGPQKTRVAVVPLVRQTIELLVPLARKYHVALVLGESPALDADVDAGQMQQVLTNLLLNAIQSMPAGGKVLVRAAPERVRPPPDVGGAESLHVRISVEDHGGGIRAEDLPHIFEPFFTTKQVGEGTGLGLSVAYGIVREHGGWIGVESEVGKGSIFSVFLPLGAPA